VYNQIFFTNVLRLLEERGWTKHELSTISDVSISFVSDMTNGKANPSLETMEKIARALETPLPLLLEQHDLDPASLQQLIGTPKLPSSLPKGYERVSAVLPSAKAFVVRRWDEETRKKLFGES
jgi:transcriptional regulator with XRE-family HTH domain